MKRKVLIVDSEACVPESLSAPEIETNCSVLARARRATALSGALCGDPASIQALAAEADVGAGSAQEQRWQLLLASPYLEKYQRIEHRLKLRNILSKAVEDWNVGYVLERDPFWVIIFDRVGTEAFSTDFISREIAQALGPSSVDFSFITDEPVQSPSDLLRSFERVLECYRSRCFFAIPGKVMLCPKKGGLQSAAARPLGFGLGEGQGYSREDAVKRFLLDMEARDKIALRSDLSRLGESLSAEVSNEEAAKSELSSIFSQVVERHSRSIAGDTPAALESRAWILDLYQQRDLGSALNLSFDNLSALMRAKKPAEAAPPMKRMVELIESNYYQNLKLESLAEVYDYSSAYLGKLFKDYTGEYFNTYLDRVRINKAKEFLAQGMKVYQVAEKVGFAYVDYFHAKFKKYVGMSPSLYRSSVHAGKGKKGKIKSEA
jgi:two-component system response regulator YesN